MAEKRLVKLSIEPVTYEIVGIGAVCALLYAIGFHRGDKHARKSSRRT